MKFHIPAADSPEQEAQVYDSIKKHLGQELGSQFSDRRVRTLSWRHDGKAHKAEVGQSTNFNGEIVIAILYEQLRDLYHVCTPNRGVIRGGSILAGGHTVSDFEDFDHDPAA